MIGLNYSVKIIEFNVYEYSYNGKIKCDYFKI